MKTNRRTFLHQTAVSSAGVLLASGSASCILNSCANNKLRYMARKRKRRIIMNNDGDMGMAVSEKPINTENFLKQRTLGLLGSQVDSIFYCSGILDYYSHRSEESELGFGKDEPTREYLETLARKGTDPLKMMTDFGRKNGIELFWSMRMNDTHDSSLSSSFLFCQWKKDHPEYLVGKYEDKFPYGANRWSSVNYDIAEVREKVYNILYDVCSRYNIDGVELDFFRHPVLFKAQMTGEPVTQEQCDLMTGLLRRIRKMTEDIALERGRPLLIAIRIPDSVGYCKALGIDLIEWMEEDLVDIVTGSGYFKMEPWETLVSICHKYNVPYYACLVKRRIQSAEEPEGETLIKTWRGEALNAWKAGVDGIYTFNRFNPNDQIFRELGDAKLLTSLEHIDQTAYVNEESWSRPEVWLKDGSDFINK